MIYLTQGETVDTTIKINIFNYSYIIVLLHCIHSAYCVLTVWHLSHDNIANYYVLLIAPNTYTNQLFYLHHHYCLFDAESMTLGLWVEEKSFGSFGWKDYPP